MKKSLVEVNYQKEITDDSVIVRSHGKWVAVNKTVLLDSLIKKDNELDSKISNEKDERISDIDLLKEEVNKLKNDVKHILGEDDDEEE